jgi:hypothetical protein
MQRAQASVEYALLLGLVVLLGLGLVAAFGAVHEPRLDLGRALLPRISHRRFPTPDERALRSPTLGPLIRRAVPTLVLERDVWGDDDEVPVDAACRVPACARFGGAPPVLYVHVVHPGSGLVVELWTAYPDSRTDHLPLAALQGHHRDDWEGLLVRLDAQGRITGARASAHAGFNGSAPWWEMRRDAWAPYAGLAYRASGSHALGLSRDSIDLAGDRWNGDLGTIAPDAFTLAPADRAGRHPRPFDPATVPPWDKRAWRDPGVEHTGPPGAPPSQLARAARAWADAQGVLSS